MNDINLLRYHSRSASEIRMLLTAEAADPLFSRVVLGDFEEEGKKSKLTLLLTLAASLICAVYASYVIVSLIKNTGIDIPSLDKAAILKQVAEYKLELRTGGDPYLKDGFEKIAVVDRVTPDEHTNPVTAVSEYQPPISAETNPELFTEPVELTEEPKKRKIDKRVLVTPMFTGNYAIRFLDITESEAEKVRTLARNNDFNLNLIGSTKKSFKKYKVYKEDDKSSTLIAGKKVRYLRTFKSKSDAVAYLQKNKIAGLVSSDTTYSDYYDMEVCCLGDEAAEKLARGSGITMKKVKILKK